MTTYELIAWFLCGFLSVLLIFRFFLKSDDDITLNDVIMFIVNFISGALGLMVVVFFIILIHGKEITIWRRKK